MQGTRADRFKRIILYVLPVVVLLTTVALDQITKYSFKRLYLEKGKTIVIDGFFYFTYLINTGAAWSFLSNVSWAQTFFKILTVVALCVFVVFYLYAFKKGYKWLQYSIVLMVGGTIGNFIDRLLMNGVIDFIGFIFGKYYFPIFNLADSFLSVGGVMLVVHYLFLDKDALFKKKEKIPADSDVDIENGNENISNNGE